MNLITLILIIFSFINVENNSEILESKKNSNFSSLKYRNVGPIRGGRVTTVHGVSSKINTFYMGTTGGGVWKTTDSGNIWFNISDGYFMSPSIGSINIFQKNPDIIYVGTGSDGIRSNIIVGKGIYKSTNAGKSWEFIGL